jgi:hypothetical protein
MTYDFYSTYKYCIRKDIKQKQSREKNEVKIF